LVTLLSPNLFLQQTQSGTSLCLGQGNRSNRNGLLQKYHKEQKCTKFIIGVAQWPAGYWGGKDWPNGKPYLFRDYSNEMFRIINRFSRTLSGLAGLHAIDPPQSHHGRNRPVQADKLAIAVCDG
jgi:hypothetical protein